MWLIEDFKNSGIDVKKCIFGVLPLGNSNDLSSSLGWGSKVDASSDMEQFKNYVKEFAEATSIFVDIWEIRIELDEVKNLFKLETR
jgi:hypothetical protein